MKQIVEELDLLRNHEGVVRVPFLVKGKIVAPPELDKAEIEAAFVPADKETLYLKLPGAQVIRERAIDRKSMKYTGEYIYQVMPFIHTDALIEMDLDGLARGLYALSVQNILDYLHAIAGILDVNTGPVRSIIDISRQTAELPDEFLDGWEASMADSLNRETARQVIDTELSIWGKPGSEFLGGWVEVASRNNSVPTLAQDFLCPAGVSSSARSFIRAMPTRQLHITAGNSHQAPAASLFSAVMTKSASAIKLPFGGTLAGSMLGAAMAALPDHPITRHTALVYWWGGDESVENALFRPGAFDRIVVWGGSETVASVQSRAPYTRTVCFNPRYGVSLIGREAFGDWLEEVTQKAAADSMIYNQKACTASLVHYVEGTEEQAELYAEALREALKRRDISTPQFVSPSARGQLKRMRRGKYSQAVWHVNEKDGEFASGVVVMAGEFDILDHPTCRLAVVRRVDDLSDALKYLHQGVSATGVYPENRRLELRDAIVARGVSSVLPLGQCERVFAGMPHDGMPVLSQLVDWKNS